MIARRTTIILGKAKRLGERGLTLVEILIAMGLLSIFLVIIATVFTSVIDIQAQTSSYSAVSSESRVIMSRLNYDIARSTAITTPAALGATSATLAMTVNASTYTYALNAGRLQLTDNIGAALLTGDAATVSALSFQRLGNSGGRESIRYSFTLTSVSQDRAGPEVQTFTSTVERR
jgi:prepilin-type N-terminal cleavage/methylation domain-containing protein